MSRQTHLHKAMSKLNVGDSLALKEAFCSDHLVQKCYQARTNPSIYLSRTFKHAVTLLSVMFDTGCIISGSRALDFFVPGSALADSDWDFYVPGYKESVADMVSALSLSGVTWESEGDTITSTLSEYGQVEASSRTLEALTSWIPTSNSDAGLNLLGEPLHEILLSFKSFRNDFPSAKNCTISRDTNGDILIQPSPRPEEPCQDEGSYETCSGEPFNMMRGSIETIRGTQSVQLIIGCHYQGIRSCLGFIKDFYASHVQCFIGGWCAAHLYYHHASKKQAAVWERSHSTKAIEKAIEKYQDRGFWFRSPDYVDPTPRRLNDNDSMFLDYGDMYRLFVRKSNLEMLDKWLVDRRHNIETIHWVEFERKIIGMYSPLETCARSRPTFFAGKNSFPSGHLRRLADIITLNTPESDRMRTKAFYSSVRKTIAGTEWGVPEVARSGGVYCALHDANPWSWTM